MSEINSEEQDFLYSFKKQYLQIIPLYNFKWQPVPNSLSMETQIEILNIIQKYQIPNKISNSYTTQCLKKIINIAEKNFCEINEDLLNFYLNLLFQEKNTGDNNTMNYMFNTNKANKEENNTWWKTYSLDKKCQNILKLLEDKSMISKGTTGLRTWEASLRLAEYFIQNPTLCQNKNIIELGSGIGLLSLICAKLGAKSVLATDVNPEVIERLKENIKSNQPTLEEENLAIPKVEKLDWNENELDMNHYQDIDLIICADVIYNPENIEPLVNILSIFLKAIPSITIILCNPLRQQSTYDLFLQQLSQHNITIHKELIDQIPIIFCHDEEFSQIQMTIINKKKTDLNTK
ncbi:S-adenosyl-L-methionine-dependent methyltransferase [Neocallimastix lanati (nom. inval.)]|uniref:S-adenosyl-L-methionine-dependent methyltransferase n=1 Tax=Neocallimastix californiae TaxID=1754190 RepID=A0A1Y1Y1X2_9FUNG|nr:S-adenosyl-L-methionine-dependent methyltransferase [Neocallimastix sp. JGI-2020a]ORX92003.1 S-adenosyl-L-methionine-dependent methyltransferase [Neocallimastix californiae]|eukprot:ORX92003.1 S-adenosyl-L-methionine-dependent methyltransferase [Neocallimastix californiae]